MAESRPSSFLPTIKCSMCAQDIEISLMGEHVCSPGEATPPPEPSSFFDRLLFKREPDRNETSETTTNKPPRVDTSAASRFDDSRQGVALTVADRPFVPKGELTPLSTSPDQSMSPNTPNDKPRSPLEAAIRGDLEPKNSPPSLAQLSSNLDSAFPRFPTSKSAISHPPESGSRIEARPSDVDSVPAPRSGSNAGLLKRMNTIAPGPFNIENRGAHHRQQSSRVTDFDGHVSRPSTASGHSRTSTVSSTSSTRGPPRMPRKESYGGFGPRSIEEDAPTMLRSEDRAETFPQRVLNQKPPPDRRPSEPYVRTEAVPPRSPRRPSQEPPSNRRPSEPYARMEPPPLLSARRPSAPDTSRPWAVTAKEPKQSISGPDLSRPLPPRGASLLRARTDSRLGDAPPVPSSVNLAVEFGVGNPYHTPTESQSSSASGYSEGSRASSRSSPPTSAGPGRARQPSDAYRLNTNMSDVQSSMARLQARTPSPGNSPVRPKEQFARSLAPPENLSPSLLSAESPVDPAIQAGKLSPISPRSPARLETPTTSPEKPASGRKSAASKGNCKGCGEAIKGKSISSADGRLTGRYHKQCFVCVTCSEPFQTSTFYVINDSPYCERHYHKLNNSVCYTCDRGIEGQYLESERKQKFHPSCLTCADCKRNLRHDYFEMNGQVYCERDAFRRAQKGRFLGPGSGTNRMERRTTRLMMMQ